MAVAIYLRLKRLCAVLIILASTMARADMPAGGNITEETLWTGTILVYSNVVVRSPATLTIEAGAIVRLTNRLASLPMPAGMSWWRAPQHSRSRFREWLQISRAGATWQPQAREQL